MSDSPIGTRDVAVFLASRQPIHGDEPLRVRVNGVLVDVADLFYNACAGVIEVALQRGPDYDEAIACRYHPRPPTTTR